ncbi:hypothetical protein [Sorangium sp. So ce1024]|uniref:hypothetical protein n=1 Tax=unclassified Sorangium TaxID=2621164 RepID=UPI003F0D1F89
MKLPLPWWRRLTQDDALSGALIPILVASVERRFSERAGAPSCGHGQHVRHAPRCLCPWVRTPTELDCVRRDRLEELDGLVAYRRTAEFDEGSIPRRLQKKTM